MPALHRRRFVVAAFACGLFVVCPVVSPAQPPDDKALARALRAGGNVILVRHGATVGTETDVEPYDFDDITKQRNLSESGRALAKAFGDGLRRAGAPIGKVYTSKFNRAYETATLAGFTDVEKTADLTLGASPDEKDRHAAALRALLSAPPKAGTNTVLITHQPNIVDALGKNWSDVEEGEALIFHPQDGKYLSVARVQMTEWPRIAGAAK